MSKICDKCNNNSITFIRYNGTHLCKEHFIQYFEKRVKKEIKKQGKTNNNCKIGVAISGGKDSLVALNIINDIFSKRRGNEIIAITVDEGIKGYRDKSIKFAEFTCKKLGIEHNIVKFKDIFSKTMDEIASLKNELGECSYCGVFRRLCLNIKSKDLDIKKLVTGHNLDDMTQSILMNFTNGEVHKLARLGPHKIVKKGLVPRMIPLRTIPEKEIALYALFKNINYHNGECPYSAYAYRRIFRDIIDDLEYKNPGTKYGILTSYDHIKILLKKLYISNDLNKCIRCSEPTSQKLCKACTLKETLI